MKGKIFIFTLLLLAMFVPTAFAHTHLESSNPADGQEVSEKLDEITLTFGEKIEKGSTFQLLDEDGQKIELENINVDGTQLSGVVPTNLPNGRYKVNWDIIAADGHQMEGEFSFSINIAGNETAEDQTISKEKTDRGNSESNNTDQNSGAEKAETNTASDHTDHGTSPYVIPVIALLLLLAIIVFFVLLRRRK